MEKDADKLTNQEETKYCFFRISVAGNDPQTVVIQLDVDTCPLTCRNFCAICASAYRASRPRKNELDRGKVPPPPPTYRGTDFHRVIPSFMVQGGDYENFDGSGGKSAVAAGGYFKDENLHSRKHDREGILSMANRGPNTNGSQFFITLGKSNHLDGKHVAFGEVILGMDVVRLMSGVECVGERPCAMQRITVVDCGIGRGKKPKKLEGGCRGRSGSVSRDRKEPRLSRSRSRDRDGKESRLSRSKNRDYDRKEDRDRKKHRSKNRDSDREIRRSRDREEKKRRRSRSRDRERKGDRKGRKSRSRERRRRSSSRSRDSDRKERRRKSRSRERDRY